MAERMTVRPQTVKQFLSRPDHWDGPYDIVFADPPYAVAGELESLFAAPALAQLFAADSWLVVEHAEKTTLPAHLGQHVFLRRYHYGDTALSIYSSFGAARS
jgi:16S rRNA G966 N2-methylase RsmD